MTICLPLPALRQPRISVVICNYNYEQYLGQTLDSVAQQNYPAFEIIVVDDGSTDRSLEVIRARAPKTAQLISQANGGQISAYNTGFERASGDVVLFLDSDDALLPDALAEVATRFDEGVAKVHFRLDLIGPDGERLGSTIPHELGRGAVAAAFLERGIPHASPPASGNAYRRSVLKEIFPLPSNPNDRHGADFFCIFGSTLFGTVAPCEGSLGLYRAHRTDAGAPGFVFGNAAKGLSLEKRLQSRLEIFSVWIHERTRGAIEAPPFLLDFSIEKSAYATTAFAGQGWWKDKRAALARLPRLLKSIVIRHDYSLAKKAGLMVWAVLIIGAPRALGIRAARYVCDPASRARSVPGLDA